MAFCLMDKSSRMVTEAQQRFSFSRRAFVLRGAQTAVGGLLLARMGWLSIVESEHFQTLSESNRVNLSLIPPRRGWIVDRNGKPLALNRTSFRVDVIPDRMVDKDKTVAALVQILNLTSADQQKIADALGDAAGFQPVQIADNLSWDAYAALSIRAPELPGVAPAQSFSRYYPDGAGVAHLLGFVGPASAKEYEETRNPLLITPGYKVGKDGIEKIMEAKLRGTPGARRTEVTARGKLVRDLANRPDVPGQTQRLTIDAALQNFVSRRLGPASGACTILDCMTGDILALSSMPAYDPNSFTGGISKSEWAMLSEDDHIPLANKAFQGLYPSGSTVKPMMALALLQAGVNPDDHVVCSGSYRVGNSIFHCDKRSGHGAISMHNAIVHSCDIYFYHMGKTIGIERIAPMMRAMTLGQKYDLPVPSQRFGTVPDPAWLKKRYKREWSTYDTINVSIGQGYLLVNPVQLAVMAGRLASGRAIQPHLLLDHPHAAAPPLPIDPAHLEFVRKGMWGVVNEGGTAGKSRLQVKGVAMAGKTGTAQVRRITMAERAHGVRSNASLPWKFRDHSLFIGFTPADNPKYAGACIIEHGGAGAQAAAPLMRDVMTFLFDPAGALASLAELETGWGGTIEERMNAERARWDAAHQVKSTAPPGSANSADDAANAANGAAPQNEAESQAPPSEIKSQTKAKAVTHPADDLPSAETPLPPDALIGSAPLPPPPDVPPIPTTAPAP
jgi:penicillin-binding protein 2